MAKTKHTEGVLCTHSEESRKDRCRLLRVGRYRAKRGKWAVSRLPALRGNVVETTIRHKIIHFYPELLFRGGVLHPENPRYAVSVFTVSCALLDSIREKIHTILIVSQPTWRTALYFGVSMSFTASARIVSSIPGRLRIRDCSLKNPDRLEKLGTVLVSLNHSCSFRANPAAGSLVLFYDAGQCAMEEMEDAVARMVNAAPADSNVSGDSAVVSAPKKRRILLRQANRYSKYVMCASLGISLALAARGAKRGHALAGAVFVAALGVHLAVHRKHLLS